MIRRTIEIPEVMYTKIKDNAKQEGLSVQKWIVKILSQNLDHPSLEERVKRLEKTVNG